MSQKRTLEEILAVTGLPVKYYEYIGTKKEYIVYNEEAEQLVDHGDNKPLNNIIWWQVHIFTPKSSDFRGLKESAKAALLDNDYIITDIVTLYEKETTTMHVIISCHI